MAITYGESIDHRASRSAGWSQLAMTVEQNGPAPPHGSIKETATPLVPPFGGVCKALCALQMECWSIELIRLGERDHFDPLSGLVETTQLEVRHVVWVCLPFSLLTFWPTQASAE